MKLITEMRRAYYGRYIDLYYYH